MLGYKIIDQLIAISTPEQAKVTSSFFKTQKGEYAENDIFLGVSVPQIRKVVAPYLQLELTEVSTLLHSKYHESRFAALVILNHQFDKGDEAQRKIIYHFYLDNTQYIDNWDLVDVSAHKIVGAWLIDKGKEPLYKLANSSWLWDQRIAIVATWAFIRNHQFEDTLSLSKHYMNHPHHLINKACGWMLREVGKRDKSTLIKFLDQYAPKMPRVMLRYSLEKLPLIQIKKYLSAKL